jgi:hypothetical protein
MKQLMTHARSRVTYFVFQYYNLQKKTAATVLLVLSSGKEPSRYPW